MRGRALAWAQVRAYVRAWARVCAIAWAGAYVGGRVRGLARVCAGRRARLRVGIARSVVGLGAIVWALASRPGIRAQSPTIARRAELLKSFLCLFTCGFVLFGKKFLKSA